CFLQANQTGATGREAQVKNVIRPLLIASRMLERAPLLARRASPSISGCLFGPIKVGFVFFGHAPANAEFLLIQRFPNLLAIGFCLVDCFLLFRRYFRGIGNRVAIEIDVRSSQDGMTEKRDRTAIDLRVDCWGHEGIIILLAFEQLDLRGTPRRELANAHTWLLTV